MGKVISSSLSNTIICQYGQKYAVCSLVEPMFKKLVSDNYAQMGKKLYFAFSYTKFHTTTIVYIVNPLSATCRCIDHLAILF